jgi:putative flippase GtrA
MKTLTKEFCRYLLVGGTAFVADFATLALLTDLAGMHYLLSATVGFAVGTVVNYLLSTRWVFSVRAVSNPASEFLLFAAIGMAGVLLNGGIIAFCVEVAGTGYPLGKIAATGLILFFNFGMRKWLLFSDALIRLRTSVALAPLPSVASERSK